MNRIQAFGILLIILSAPAFIFGGFVLGWPALAGGFLMYILFGKGEKREVVKEVEKVE